MAMRFKDPESLLKLKFISEQMEAIKTEYQKHKPATGYVMVAANKNFQPVEAPRFIKREFEKRDYVSVNEEETKEESAIREEDWVYYEIYWSHDHSTWRLKEKV